MKIAFLGAVPVHSWLTGAPAKKWEHPAPWVMATVRPLLALGAQGRLFTSSRAVSLRRTLTSNNLPVEILPRRVPLRLDRLMDYCGAGMQFRPRIRAYAPDVVLAYGTETGYASIGVHSKLPCVIFVQGIVEKLAPWLKVGPFACQRMQTAERCAVTHARAFLAETQFAADWIKTIRPDARVRVVPHPLTLDPQPWLGRAKHPNKVVCVASLARYKGVDTVIRAFAPLARGNAELAIIGSGPGLEALQELAAELGATGHIHFRGYLPHEAVLDELASAAVCVLGSRMDTAPNVITEAHALGTPVVGTAAGGIPEMIDSGTDGFVVPADQPVAMQDRLHELLHHPQKAAAMGEAGRIKVLRVNDPVAVARAIFEFLTEITAHP
jgi:glycosyltransferase involved in cell wall biosynthesis